MLNFGRSFNMFDNRDKRAHIDRDEVRLEVEISDSVDETRK